LIDRLSDHYALKDHLFENKALDQEKNSGRNQVVFFGGGKAC